MFETYMNIIATQHENVNKTQFYMQVTQPIEKAFPSRKKEKKL